MNTLFHSNEIELLEKGDINNPVYLITGNGRFYHTEYRIMDNYPELLRCFKATLNGRTELVYVTDGLVPMSIVLPQIQEESFLLFAVKICEAVINISGNGFLDWQHIDYSKDRVFVNMTDRSIHLAYLPVEGVYLPPELMDNEIRKYIASLSKESKCPDSEILATLRCHVQSENESILAFTGYLKNLLSSKETVQRVRSGDTLMLVNDEQKHTIVVDKPKFLIGKKAQAVDGVIPYSKFVGRVHCQIVNKDGNYYVYDLDSKNGTTVNKVAVIPEKGMLLKNGDTLKIANVLFSVIFSGD